MCVCARALHVCSAMSPFKIVLPSAAHGYGGDVPASSKEQSSSSAVPRVRVLCPPLGACLSHRRRRTGTGVDWGERGEEGRRKGEERGKRGEVTVCSGLREGWRGGVEGKGRREVMALII